MTDLQQGLRLEDSVMTAFRNGGSRLAFEHLEAKQLLAGDVAISVVQGNLIVEGDELGNQIAITAGQNPGQYIIRGLDGTRVHLGGAPTPNEPSTGVMVNGVRRDVWIRMKGGDDLVAIYDASFRGNVGIGTEGGNDTIRIGSHPVDLTSAADMPWDAPGGTLDRPAVTIRGNLTVVTGMESDTVVITRATVVGAVDIRTGDDNDRVHLGIDMSVTTPSDSLAEVNVLAAKPSLMVGRGTNISLGDGSDALIARGLRSPTGVVVLGGEGRDEISIRQTQAGERLWIDAGLGEMADNVSINRVHARTALVTTGAGNDQVKISDSSFALLGVTLEEGDDHLTLRGVKSRASVLLGGLGEDTLTLLGENHLGLDLIQGFEHRGT